MINFHITNLVSRLNNGEKDLKLSQINKTIITILDSLELKGFLNYKLDPYKKEIFIFNNIIKHISIKSKPSRNIYVEKNIFKLNIGNFIYNNRPLENKKEVILFVE